MQVMENTASFRHCRPVMEAMERLDKKDMEVLRMAQKPETGLEVYYSAHTDHMYPEVHVIFIGI